MVIVSKKSSIALVLTLIVFGSYLLFSTFQFNNNNLISTQNLNVNQIDSPIRNIKTSTDLFSPNITKWYFNDTTFNSSNLLYSNVNATANITVTVTDESGVKNVTLWYDTNLDDRAGPGSILMSPGQINKTLSAEENRTITGIALNATGFINNVSATNFTDGFYHSYANGTNGILMAYALNLTNYNNTPPYTHIYFVNISIRAFINNTAGVTWAGWQIWNNGTRSLDNVDNLIFNNTNNVTDFIILNSDNITNYIDQTNNSRIEIFINITSSNPVRVSVDYIGFNVTYNSDNYTATIPGLPWERIAWDGTKWTYTQDIVKFWVNATDIYDNVTSTKSSKFNYTIIDVEKPLYYISLINGSYASRVTQIVMRGIDYGSGIQKMTLQIDGNLTQNRIWSNSDDFKAQDPFLQNITVYYNWNVTDYPNYNGTSGTNATHIINFTVYDRQGNFNSTNNFTIYIDNEPPYGAYLNLRTNDLLDLNATVLENKTITNTILNATNFQNSTLSTYEKDGIYHAYSNGSAGILMVYAVELGSYNLSILDNIYAVNVTMWAKINNTVGVKWAGWQIWNWTGNNIYDINGSAFNSTYLNSAWFIITRENSTAFINETKNSRIEFFINVTSSNPIEASVDFIGYHVDYYKTLDIYSDQVVNTNLSLRFGGYDNNSLDKFILYANSQQIFVWINGTNATKGINNYYNFNSSALPNGALTLNLTVLDKAGNTNSTLFNIKIDNIGPDINFTVLLNNSFFSNNGSWNFIVPITFYALDGITSVQKIELYIDGALGTVLPGQDGQIINYDAYGNIIYVQQNATWYEGGTFTYYWNASIYATGSRHNLSLYAIDIMGNPSNYSIFINKTTYLASVSIEFIGFSTIPYVQNLLFLSFKITNTGNCTLFNFDLNLHFYFLNKTWVGLELGWVSVIQVGDLGQKKWLLPGESMTVEFLIYGLSYYSPGYFEVFLNVSAKSVEQFLNMTTAHEFAKNQEILSYAVPYENIYMPILPYLILFISAFGLGILLHILIRRIRIRYQKLQEVMAEKLKDTKKNL